MGAQELVNVNTPAKYLSGKILEGGWLVKENITKEIGYNAKSFAETYIVENNGQVAMLKALDFSIALLDPDPTTALIQLSKSYDFEKELLELCKSKRLSKIVHIIAQGKIPALEGSIIPVPYFILEYAGKDIKSQLDFDSCFNMAWLMRILHNVSIGLFQLHNQKVAHTDLRPENVKEFSKKLQKLTELGNSDIKGLANPSKGLKGQLDPAYATPEYLYGHTETDWIYKSQAADVYNLGNMVFFLFTQFNFNSWLYIFLDDSHKHDKWGGTYSEVLPYLIEAYDKAVYFFIGFIGDEEITTQLEPALRQLCHPDPRKRGHPRDIESIGSSMSVERYVSLFRRLAILTEQKVK